MLRVTGHTGPELNTVSCVTERSLCSLLNLFGKSRVIHFAACRGTKNNLSALCTYPRLEWRKDRQARLWKTQRLTRMIWSWLLTWLPRAISMFLSAYSIPYEALIRQRCWHECTKSISFSHWLHSYPSDSSFSHNSVDPYDWILVNGS